MKLWNVKEIWNAHDELNELIHHKTNNRGITTLNELYMNDKDSFEFFLHKVYNITYAEFKKLKELHQKAIRIDYEKSYKINDYSPYNLKFMYYDFHFNSLYKYKVAYN